MPEVSVQIANRDYELACGDGEEERVQELAVHVRDEYGGCRSWLQLQRELPFEGTPVLSDDEFYRAAEEITAICDGALPALV